MTSQLITPPGASAESLSFPKAPVLDGGFLVTADNRFLPPHEFRRIPSEKIPTPTDDRGLINVSQLLRDVLDTVDPEYVWPTGTKDHHFYWPRAAYELRPSHDVNPSAFRNLTIHKGRLPIVFENWLHEVTLPAPVPSAEVMHYRMESWRVASSLFHNARQIVRWERLGRKRAEFAGRFPYRVGRNEAGVDLGEELISEIIGRYFSGLDLYRSKLEMVPPEFRLCDPESSHEDIAKTLGEIVVPKALKLSKAVRYRQVEPLAA